MSTIATGVLSTANIGMRWGGVAVQLQSFGMPPAWIEDGKGFESLWRETRKAKADHYLYVADCVVLCAGFNEVLAGFVKRHPLDVISLHAPGPKFAEAYAGGSDIATSFDGFAPNPSASAYVWPADVQADFLEFRARWFKPAVLKRVSAEAQMATYCMATRRKVLHPLPCPIDVDGPDELKPVIRWNNTAGNLDSEHRPVDVGLCYPDWHWSLRIFLTQEGQRHFGVVEHVYELERSRA